MPDAVPDSSRPQPALGCGPRCHQSAVATAAQVVAAAAANAAAIAAAPAAPSAAPSAAASTSGAAGGALRASAPVAPAQHGSALYRPTGAHQLAQLAPPRTFAAAHAPQARNSASYPARRTLPPPGALSPAHVFSQALLAYSGGRAYSQSDAGSRSAMSMSAGAAGVVAPCAAVVHSDGGRGYTGASAPSGSSQSIVARARRTHTSHVLHCALHADARCLWLQTRSRAMTRCCGRIRSLPSAALPSTLRVCACSPAPAAATVLIGPLHDTAQSDTAST
eukprot:IDg6861t1